MVKRVLFLAAALVMLMVMTGCSGSSTGSASSPSREAPSLRIGYFANVTHAQAVVGFNTGRFQKAVGESVRLEPRVFNAGPSVIEAVFAGELDLAYVGPSPAVNGFVKSKGQALRIVAGAATGGAVLVVQPGLSVKAAADLQGMRVATPQLGNTQDVALRSYLKGAGVKTAEAGGSVKVINAPNAEIETLFRRKEIDAAWVPEPWGARLIESAGGVIAVDERTLWPDGRFATTVVIASVKVLQERPEAVAALLGAHVEVTRWLAEHPEEGRTAINDGLDKLTGKRLPEKVLTDALSRVQFGVEPPAEAIAKAAQQAYDLGFLGQVPPMLEGLFDLSLLQKVNK